MKKINNYEELLAERKRLDGQIAEQKLILKEEFLGVKDKLEPFLNLLPVLNIFRKQETNRPLLSTISSLGIDLVGQKFLSKAGWVTKFMVPLIAKGISAGVFRFNKLKSS